MKSFLKSNSEPGLLAERVEIDGKPYGKITGTAYKWNTVGNFGVRGGYQAVDKMGFTASLEKRLKSSQRDILCLRSHEGGRVLARSANGKLEVYEDDDGVQYVAYLNLEDPESLGAFTLIEDGTLDASSMGYVPIESDRVTMLDNSTEAEEAGEKKERKVSVATEADLVEISIVAHGVYNGASALAAEESQETGEPKYNGYMVVSQYTEDHVLIGETVHRTIDYEVHTEIETEWEGEPYWSPMIRRRQVTTTHEVDEMTVDSDESDESESEASSEEEVGTTTSSDGGPDSDDLNWRQHKAELDELGITAFTSGV